MAGVGPLRPEQDLQSTQATAAMSLGPTGLGPAAGGGPRPARAAGGSSAVPPGAGPDRRHPVNAPAGRTSTDGMHWRPNVSEEIMMALPD